MLIGDRWFWEQFFNEKEFKMATKKAAKKVAKKVATKRAAKKAPAKRAPKALTAEAVMEVYGLTYCEGGFESTNDSFAFFQSDAELVGSCAVRVFSDFDDRPRFGLSRDEQIVLFRFNVLETLGDRNRKQAIATTIQQQTYAAGLLESAGFIPSGTSVNPSSGNSVTVWVLSI